MSHAACIVRLYRAYVADVTPSTRAEQNMVTMTVGAVINICVGTREVFVDWETLKSNLADYSADDSALTQTVHEIDEALVRRSADPTALYSDRVGLLGPKWIDALETVCPDDGSAGQLLNEICGVLWSDKGLVQIWDGFREQLGELQVEREQAGALFESEAVGLWAKIELVRETLEQEHHQRFDKLQYKSNLLVWKACGRNIRTKF